MLCDTVPCSETSAELELFSTRASDPAEQVSQAPKCESTAEEPAQLPPPLLIAIDLLGSALGVTVPKEQSTQKLNDLWSSFGPPLTGLLVGEGGAADSSLW